MKDKFKEEYDKSFNNLFKETWKEQLKDYLEILIVIVVFGYVSLLIGNLFSWNTSTIGILLLLLILSYMDIIPIGLSSISPMKKRKDLKFSNYKKTQLKYILSEVLKK